MKSKIWPTCQPAGTAGDRHKFALPPAGEDFFPLAGAAYASRQQDMLVLHKDDCATGLVVIRFVCTAFAHRRWRRQGCRFQETGCFTEIGLESKAFGGQTRIIGANRAIWHAHLPGRCDGLYGDPLKSRSQARAGG